MKRLRSKRERKKKAQAKLELSSLLWSNANVFLDLVPSPNLSSLLTGIIAKVPVSNFNL